VRENLEAARRLQNVRTADATGRVIARLGLSSYEHTRAANLSSGNRQRLGLARALLHSPELLILDEPANGLDPAGVVEIRELIADLSKNQGVTILMSSHILTEVDRLATRIGIIHRGRMLEELDNDKLESLRARRLEVATRNPDAARAALTGAGYAIRAADHPGMLVIDDPRAIAAPDEIANLLVQAGAPPTHLAVAQEDLEDHFLRITGG
jgi:ABC-2 type transport system ATP-binding protein